MNSTDCFSSASSPIAAKPSGVTRQTIAQKLVQSPPGQIVAIGVLVAGLVFFLEDQLELLFVPQLASTPLRFIHIGRGFLATCCGMFYVWCAMSTKEKELISLRNHFSDELDIRTSQLSDSNARLLAEVEQRKEAQENLQTLLSKLARSNNTLSQFARIASHDLQEPLRVIQGYADLLQRRYRGRLDRDADEFIASIVSGTKRMESLIQGILQHCQIERQPRAAALTDCSAVLSEALSNLKQSIADSAATITSDPLPRVMGDSSQLGQLFQNLIANAIKFGSDQPPRIHVSAKRKGPDWEFSVSDNGTGISPEYKEQIFHMFKRLHNRSYPGSGIGLAICKSVVENHGGRIWVESEPGKGSTFFFTLRSATTEEG